MSATSKKQNNTREFQLQKAWNRTSKNKTFVSKDKKNIKIVSCGIWNLEEGPDFKNAKIEIDGKEFVGDVEIHLKSSDWEKHGHSSNPLYSNVILHVVAEDDTEKTNFPSNIPVIFLSPQKSKLKPSRKQEFPNGKCVNYFSGFADEEIKDMLLVAGLKRLAQKTEKFMSEILVEGSDGVLLKNIFSAFGYKKNSENFVELFRRYSKYELQNHIDRAAVLWGESGLMPDPVSSALPEELRDFFAQIWKIWWKKRQSDNNPIPWIYSGVRPVNMPERRIAALSILLEKLGNSPIKSLVKAAKESDSAKGLLTFLEKLLTCSDPIWNRYLIKGSFRKESAVLGKQRARDIIVNIILPALKAYAKVNNLPDINEKCDQAFLSCGSTETNSITRLASQRWFMPPSRAKRIIKNAATMQGAIHLFRTYCESCSFDCEKCRIKMPFKK